MEDRRAARTRACRPRRRSRARNALTCSSGSRRSTIRSATVPASTAPCSGRPSSSAAFTVARGARRAATFPRRRRTRLAHRDGGAVERLMGQHVGAERDPDVGAIAARSPCQWSSPAASARSRYHCGAPIFSWRCGARLTLMVGTSQAPHARHLLHDVARQDVAVLDRVNAAIDRELHQRCGPGERGDLLPARL
jgi:hypothetical protein